MLDTELTGADAPDTTTSNQPDAPAVATRPRRRRAASRPAGPPQDAPAGADAAAAASSSEPAAAGRAPARRRSRKVAAAAPAEAAAPAAEAAATGDGTAAEAVPATQTPAEVTDTADTAAARKPARRRARKSAAPTQDAASTDGPAPADGPTPAEQAHPAVPAGIEDEPSTPSPDTEGAAEPEPGRRRRRAVTSPAFIAPEPVFRAPDVPERATATLIGGDDIVLDDEDTDQATAETPGRSEDDETDATARRRRRRRGGRGRRRRVDDEAGDEAGDAGPESAAGDQIAATDTDESDTDEAGQDADSEADTESDEDETGAGSRRRRRRRRRKGEDGDLAPDDPENTVVRIREPRSRTGTDEITALKGSTRIEAKKQRRREGREAGRRRPPIATEAEFLARRESVQRVMVVRQHPDLTQIALLEDGVLVEHYVSRESQQSMIGNVYLGRVQNVLPAMEAAFVDVGRGRNAVLYAGEVDWDGLGQAGQPKRIEAALKSGQGVLVQVTKDPIGHKGARLTSQVSLPGRYLVYVPGGSMSGISRKLPDTERNRLKKILKGVVPEDAGVIVRTAAEGATEEELTNDVTRLAAQWADIQKKASSGSAPTLLHGEPDLTVKVVRDLFNEDVSRLVVSGADAWQTISPYVEAVAPGLSDRLEKWTGDTDVFAAYRIDEQIAKALDRKVWLPSGGSLVIDRTEAMTVVDVNTGKFTGSGGNLEETVTRNNLEAAEEIVRQLRLRDIGGIIVIDFIDMVLEGNRELVLRRLVECLGRDRTKHQVAEVTSLGLVQMTRKRIGIGLLEAFSEPCEHCKGRGVIIHHEPIGVTGHGEPAGDDSGQTGRESGRRRRSGRSGEDRQPQPAGPSPADILATVHAASLSPASDNGEPAPSGPVVALEPDVAVSEPDAAALEPASVGAVPDAAVAPQPPARPRRRRATRQTGPAAGAPTAAAESSPDGSPAAEPSPDASPAAEPSTDASPAAEPSTDASPTDG